MFLLCLKACFAVSTFFVIAGLQCHLAQTVPKRRRRGARLPNAKRRKRHSNAAAAVSTAAAAAAGDAGLHQHGQQHPEPPPPPAQPFLWRRRREHRRGGRGRAEAAGLGRAAAHLPLRGRRLRPHGGRVPSSAAPAPAAHGIAQAPGHNHEAISIGVN